MKTSLFALRISALLFGMMHTFQAHAAEAVWPSEPRAVFGVALGQALDPAAVPPCPEGDTLRGLAQRSKGLCATVVDVLEGVQLRNTPDVGFIHTTAMTMVGGKVMQIALNFQNFQFDRAIAVLTAKYGAPMEEKTDSFKTRGGGTFSSRTLTWTGRETLLIAMERTGHLDAAQVAFIDLRTFAELQKANQEVAKRGAAGL